MVRSNSKLGTDRAAAAECRKRGKEKGEGGRTGVRSLHYAECLRALLIYQVMAPLFMPRHSFPVCAGQVGPIHIYIYKNIYLAIYRASACVKRVSTLLIMRKDGAATHILAWPGGAC